MAICKHCGMEMTERVSCVEQPVEYPDGLKLPQIKYQRPTRGNCHDCGTPNGGFHHPGCDMERCPRCREQLISCGCLDPENKDQLRPPLATKVSPEVEEAVTTYWVAYYMDQEAAKACILCNNDGMIEPNHGGLVPCICPNGQAYRRARGEA